jgi:hypothetical protein
MKKIVTLIFSSLLIITASAQFQKGNKVLGFGLNIQNGIDNTLYPASETTNKGFSLGGTVSLARAKSESRINGFTVTAGYGKSKYKSTTPFASEQFSESFDAGVGYFMRKYKPLGKNFFVFGEAQASLNYNRQIRRAIQNNTDQNSYQGTIGIYPGVAYKWNDRFLLEIRFSDFAALSYNYSERKYSNEKTYSRNASFGTSLGLGYLNNIGIGIRWIIK